jgi:hypothetical protein
MDMLQILKSEYLSIIFGGLAGILTAWLTQRVLNKRGLFTYYVNHNRVGMSTEDSVFGNVSVTWNNNPIKHLFFSTIELKNESLNDYENITIKTYTGNTRLLSESTQILETPNIIEWTEKFKNQLHVENGQAPTNAQQAIYNRQREYLIPVFNRGQAVRISYLNSAESDEIPSIWLSATIKGVKVKFRIPQEQIHGIPRPHAAIMGVIIGLILIIPLVIYIPNTWIVAFLAIVYGFVAQVPGALFIKMMRNLREVIGG